MKYWAYLNDEVSQKSYTEQELQELEGFGPDILVCSEVSAVSRDPEWRPVKEVLPHLIRPKAPDFAKFRPTPPNPFSNSQTGMKKSLHSKDSDTRFAPSAPNRNIPDVNNDLLTQLHSLTEKITSLENKLEEQEQELLEGNSGFDNEFEEGQTIISDPKDEQEDDVLEVPFDNDFEVPFDINKSSEEIAREAEAILAKPTNTEIEEYNTDDQTTEFMNYASDMQKILEDTIRQDNYPKEQTKKKEPKTDKGTFIAEDLISKKTLKFTGKTDSDDKDSAQQESRAENNNKEVAAEDKKSESNKADENIKAMEDSDKSATNSEEKQEEISDQKSEDIEKEISKQSDKEEQEITQEEQNKSEIKSLDDLLNSDDNESKKEEEEKPKGVKTLITPIDEANIENTDKPSKEDDVQEKPQLSSID